MLDSTNPDLRAFEKRGGKMIVTIGTNDTLASPGAQLDYYQAVLDKMGRRSVDRFARLFVMPQTGHGLSGTSYTVDGTGKTITADADSESLRSDGSCSSTGSRTWNVAPPMSVVVTAGDRSLPLCSYPSYPRYASGPAESGRVLSLCAIARASASSITSARGDIIMAFTRNARRADCARRGPGRWASVASFAIAAAQNARPPPSGSPRIRVVNVAQRGGPPTGPSTVVIEHDQTLATHTIYRPAEPRVAKHGVLVWGEGGCAKNGLTFPEFLTELASHGFVIIADGPPVENAGRGGAPVVAVARTGRRCTGRRCARRPAARRGRWSTGRCRAPAVPRAEVRGAADASDDRRNGTHSRPSTGLRRKATTGRAASTRRSRPAAWRRWACRAAG